MATEAAAATRETRNKGQMQQAANDGAGVDLM
jgi:hypothetical protein